MPGPSETLSLRSFHIALILVAIVLASGTGAWALFHAQVALGLVSFALAVALIGYIAYFGRKPDSAIRG